MEFRDDWGFGGELTAVYYSGSVEPRASSNLPWGDIYRE